MNGRKWTVEDETFLIQNYEIFGGKYVSEKLSRDYGFIVGKANHMGLRSQVDYSFIEKDILIEKMKISHSYRDLLFNLGKVINGLNLRILKSYIEKYNIPKDTLIINIDRTNRKRKPTDVWLQEGTNISSSKLKDRLYKEGLKKRKCEKCGQDEWWNGEKLSLILDHINGIRNDNRLNNLRILCPNCNATLETHCRGTRKIKQKSIKILKNRLKKEKIKKVRIRLRKVERPPYEQLIKEINELGYCGVGRKYGVTDNSIRKWKKYYEK